jgi:NAD(P)-dependent dehydrogenase (short-subunit alcohol dehydrogenase family)
MSPYRIDLSGKRAIVTGASRGLGRAIAEGLAAAGAKVLVTDVEDCTETVQRIDLQGGVSVGARVDITDFEQCRAAAALAVERFGGIDVLVNNAGLYGALKLQPFEAISESEWTACFAVNVMGTWNMCRAVAPAMRSAGQGSVVNFSSATARTGVAFFAHYASSKAAVLGLTRALARELGESGIRVNSVAPTFVPTEGSKTLVGLMLQEVMQTTAGQQALHRNATPEDIVGVVLFLASDLSALITAHVLAPDGGLAPL